MIQALSGQLLVGLLNGVNFAHGALYMMGAFAAWMLTSYLGIGYWWALLLAPAAVGLVGVVVERTMLRRLYGLDNLYGLFLTFGLTLIAEGIFHHLYGNSGNSYP